MYLTVHLVTERHLTYGNLVPSISIIEVKGFQELAQCVFQ